MTSSGESPPVALTIAGSDSGGGAGIQADIRAMSRRGVHACSVLTALTAQNSRGVNDIHPVPPEFVREQIRTVTDDFPVNATKTGMLLNESVIRVVVEERDRLGTLVVDPVMVAASGDSLLETSAEQTLARDLLPTADLITPNLPEARVLVERLSGETSGDPRELGRTIAAELEGPHVLIKGGHEEGSESVDRLLRPNGDCRLYSAPRISTANTHGSGCVFSSLIAAERARGTALEVAVQKAKELLTEWIRTSYAPGSGPGTLNLLHEIPDND